MKEQVKKERDMLRETNSFLESEISKLTKAAQRGQQKIESLKEENARLTQELRRERKVSNCLILDAMAEAQELMSQALAMMDAQIDLDIKSDKEVIDRKQRHSSELRKERGIQSTKSERLKRKHARQLKKLTSEHDSSVSLLAAKHERRLKKVKDEKEKLVSVQAKLSLEVKSWILRYDELAIWSKSELKEERAKRRRIVKD